MPLRYRTISGADLAQGMAAAGVTAAQFAALFGAQPKRVEKWLKDEVEIPHAVALFVGLIADPQILEKALVITQYMVDRTPPSAEDEARRKEARQDAKKAAKAAKVPKADDAASGRVRDRRPAAPPRPAAEARATGTASRTR
jgi:hypothetical protein